MSCFNRHCKRCTGHSRVTFTFSLFKSAAATLRSDRDSCKESECFLSIPWKAALLSNTSRPLQTFPPLGPRACLRTPKYAIERIIHHYGVSEVVSSSCLFPTISYFHTGDSHLAFLQDRLIFSGNTHSVVSAQ